MTHDDALESLATHPHAWRFRQLCAESNADVEQRDGYRELVVRLASGRPLETPPVRVETPAAERERGPSRCCGGPPPAA